MAAPQPNLVASELVQKLNDARLLHRDHRSEPVAQAQFRVQGLKAKHPGAYLAVQSMIAVLKQDVDALEVTAAELHELGSYDLTSAMNVLRSLSALRCRDSAARLALDLADQVGPDMWLITQVTDCLLVTPHFEAMMEVAVKHAARHDWDPQMYPDVVLVKSLSEVDVAEDDVSHLLTTAFASLSDSGYDLAPISMAMATRFDDEDVTRVMARFSLRLSSEEIFDIEDGLMDELIRLKNAPFCSGAINVSVMPYGETNE